ncbi:MAG: hypothetical protein QM730_30110 [Anaerolineales bacterium]
MISPLTDLALLPRLKAVRKFMRQMRGENVNLPTPEQKNNVLSQSDVVGMLHKNSF